MSFPRAARALGPLPGTVQSMPNWCEHDITFSGHDFEALDVVTYAVQASGNGNLQECSLLTAFLPVPEALVGTIAPPRLPHLPADIERCQTPAERAGMLAANEAFARQSADLVERFGFDNWYDWSVAAWGTKWPDRIYEMVRRPRSVRISGACAWAPPLPALERISVLFPTLRVTIEYFEGCGGFAGKQVLRAGSVLVSSERPYRGARGG